jgi:hypothetical protein
MRLRQNLVVLKQPVRHGTSTSFAVRTIAWRRGDGLEWLHIAETKESGVYIYVVAWRNILKPVLPPGM